MKQEEHINKIKSTRSPFKKRLLIGLGVFLLLCIGAAVFIKYTWKPFVGGKIKEAISKATAGLYVIDFADLDYNMITGSAKFDSIVLSVDTVALNKIKNMGEAPNDIYEIKISKLLFTDFYISEIYFGKELDLDLIQIDRPKVAVTYHNWNTKADSVVKKTAYEQISGFVNSLSINKINLNSADIKYTDNTSATPKVTSFKNVSASVTDLKIDSVSHLDKARFYYARDISLELNDHSFRTRDGLYDISLKRFSASTGKNLIKLSRLKVKPLYREIEFSRKFKTQHDRYDISFKEVALSGINLREFNDNNRLIASKLLISGGAVDIFMNRELPPVTFDKGRNYPHMALKRLQIKTRLDSLLIRNTDISYSEYNPKSKKKGTVTFNNLKATVLNVTNDSASLAVNNWAIAKTSARLMNTADINVNINFNLNSSNGDFNFNGRVGKMDMRMLNKLTRNMSLAEIESGKIDKAEFKVNANLQRSTGTIKLYYRDLRVSLLKNDDETNKLEKKGVVSALANVIVKNNNPGDDGVLRIGETNAERAKEGSFFNLMWKSIFEGMKQSVGVTLSSVEKTTVEPTKREQRKMERKLRREKRREAREDKN